MGGLHEGRKFYAGLSALMWGVYKNGEGSNKFFCQYHVHKQDVVCAHAQMKDFDDKLCALKARVMVKCPICVAFSETFYLAFAYFMNMI